MKLLRDGLEQINLEPIKELYYELKAFWLFHPGRVKKVVKGSGPEPEGLPEGASGKVALVRAEITATTLEELTTACADLINKAAQAGARVIVFSPKAGELLLQLAPYESPRVYRQVQESYNNFWSSLAQKYQVWIVPGSRTLVIKRKRREVAFIFKPEGGYSFQLKTHASSEERASGLVVGNQISVVKTGAGPIAISFPGDEQRFEVSRIMAEKGAKLVIAMKSWSDEFELSDVAGGWARAQENNFYWLLPSHTFAPVRATIDGSGVIPHQNEANQNMVITEVDLEQLSESKVEDEARVIMRRDIFGKYLPELYF